MLFWHRKILFLLFISFEFIIVRILVSSYDEIRLDQKYIGTIFKRTIVQCSQNQ